MQIRAAPEADETDADALPSRRGVALPSGEGSGLGREDTALLVPETRRAAVLERALMRANKAVSPQSRGDAAMRSPGLDDVNMLEATRSPRLDDMLEAMQRQQERDREKQRESRLDAGAQEVLHGRRTDADNGRTTSPLSLSLSSTPRPRVMSPYPITLTTDSTISGGAVGVSANRGGGVVGDRGSARVLAARVVQHSGCPVAGMGKVEVDAELVFSSLGADAASNVV